MNLRHSPLAAAILAALATPAQAETHAAEAPAAEAAAPTAPAAPAALPTVTVTGSAIEEKSYTPAAATGRLNADLRDVPQSVTVINKAVLDDQAATTLVEALRNVPGITISAGEGGNIGDSINLRGFSARTDIFVDGFRDRGQFARDTFSIEAVEVLKGPSSMLFGRGSTGGVINQVSKKPRLQDSTEISASVGTDDYYRTTFDTNSKLSDTSAVRLAAFWQDIKTERDFAEKTGYGLAPSIRFGIGQPTEVTVSALIQRSEDVPDYGGPLLPAYVGGVKTPVDIGTRFYGFADDRFDQEVNSLTVAVRHKFSDSLTLRNQTLYSNNRTDAAPTPVRDLAVVATPACAQYTVALNTVPLNCLQLDRRTRNRVVNDESLFNLTDLTVKFKTGGIGHTLTTGAEVGLDKYRNENFVWADVTSNMANPGNPANPGDPTPDTVTEVEAHSQAVYINDQLDLTEQWKLVAGLRYDNFEADSEQTTLSSGAVARLSAHDEMLSTRAGVIFQPSAQQTYYLSYGTSFNPSAEAVTLSSNTVKLDPEESRSYEAGTKWSLLNEALLVNAAVFKVEKTNARSGSGVNTTLDGDVEVEGVELGVVGQVTQNWQIIGGAAAMTSEVNAAAPTAQNTVGKELQNVPRFSATLWSTYRLTPEWQIGAGASGSEARFVDNTETAEIPGYVRADAMIAYLQPNYDIRVNLQNLTDEQYYEFGSGGRATEAMGFRAILTGTYRF